MSEVFRIAVTARAAADLSAIYDHIAADSSDQAVKMLDRIIAGFESLQHFPRRKVVQRQHRGLMQSVRSMPVGPYLIFFRVIEANGTVRILTIRHGARRRPRRFGP